MSADSNQAELQSEQERRDRLEDILKRLADASIHTVDVNKFQTAQTDLISHYPTVQELREMEIDLAARMSFAQAARQTRANRDLEQDRKAIEASQQGGDLPEGYENPHTKTDRKPPYE